MRNLAQRKIFISCLAGVHFQGRKKDVPRDKVFRAFWIFGNVMEFPKVIPDPPLRNVKIFPDIILVKSGLGLKKI